MKKMIFALSLVGLMNVGVRADDAIDNNKIWRFLIIHEVNKNLDTFNSILNELNAADRENLIAEGNTTLLQLIEKAKKKQEEQKLNQALQQPTETTETKEIQIQQEKTTIAQETQSLGQTENKQ
jgi:hypothetical protein